MISVALAVHAQNKQHQIDTLHVDCETMRRFGCITPQFKLEVRQKLIRKIDASFPRASSKRLIKPPTSLFISLQYTKMSLFPITSYLILFPLATFLNFCLPHPIPPLTTIEMAAIERSPYTFNEMQFSNAVAQTIRRQKAPVHILRAKSMDNIRFAELTPMEVRMLLANHKNNEFANAVAKQQLLADKKLFDPFRYFGSPSFHSFEESLQYHRPRLEAMFPATSRRTPSKAAIKGTSSSKIQQSSPRLRCEQGKKTLGRSPKSYVKENKQNFMRLNLNNMQKMRVKLKLNKK